LFLGILLVALVYLEYTSLDGRSQDLSGTVHPLKRARGLPWNPARIPDRKYDSDSIIFGVLFFSVSRISRHAGIPHHFIQGE
jgi:hypothetical protein